MPQCIMGEVCMTAGDANHGLGPTLLTVNFISFHSPSMDMQSGLLHVKKIILFPQGKRAGSKKE